MIKQLEKVLITAHAAARWRERSTSGDDMVAVLREAKRLEKDDFFPYVRKPGQHYYFHSVKNFYFVVQPLDLKTSRIVTVILYEEPRTYLLPKKKQKRGPLLPNKC